MFLEGDRKWKFIAYNIVITLVACSLLIVILAFYTPMTAPKEPSGYDVLSMLLTMIAAGMAGGVLCNLRGIFDYQRDMVGEFPSRLELPFYVRPFAGAVCALVVFFVSNLVVATPVINAAEMAWGDFAHRLPFVALGLFAGYVSQEFLERLKAVAVALFNNQQERQVHDELKGQEELKAMQKHEMINEKQFETRFKALSEAKT